jgi:hypothetical protein
MAIHLMAKRPFSVPRSVRRTLLASRWSPSLMDRAGHPHPLLSVDNPSWTLRSAKEKGTMNASQRSPSTSSSQCALASSSPQSRYPTNVVREESNGASGEEVSREEVVHPISLYVRTYELVNGAYLDKETFLPITFESATARTPAYPKQYGQTHPDTSSSRDSHPHPSSSNTDIPARH